MLEQKRSSAKARPRERGVVIIYLAFFMLMMLGFIAIGIDVSKLMATRTELQRAADAAALAGASGVDFKTGKIIPDSAIVRAQNTAGFNKAFVNDPLPVQLLAADVSFPAANQVKVIVRRDANTGGSMVTHVAQVLGITKMDVSATATAEVDTAAAPCEGLVPMAPVPPVNGFDPKCGVSYTLKQDPGNGQQGNYQLLDFPNCDEGMCQDVGGGGAAIRCYSQYGYGCCLHAGDQFVQTQPGVKAGPFRQGMGARFDSDTDRRDGICYQDYKGNGMRVVRVPLIKTFDVNGKKMVQITGFAAFFMQFKPTGNGDMTGQYIYDIGPGDPGGGGGTLYSIRLVK
jgi:Flp pilus assembly protein TadG